MELDYSVIFERLPSLLKGAWVTIYLSAITLILALILGIILALFRDSKIKGLRSFSAVYIWVFRATPLLVQLFILYFGLPNIGIKLSSMSSAILGLSLNTAAYVAETVRSGIHAVDSGQREAARALGMNRFLEMTRIVAPQAAKICMLPLVNQFIITIKNSSMVSLVTITELLRAGDQIIYSTFRHFEVYTSVAVIYLIINSVLMIFANYIQRKLV